MPDPTPRPPRQNRPRNSPLGRHAESHTEGRTWTHISRLRWLVVLLVLSIALVGAFLLRDLITFDTLRDNRESLLAFRDQHYAGLALAFVVSYVVIVAFSLPGAAVASVTGGFLFGLSLGTALNVLSATLGAMGLFLAARWGFGAALSARIDTQSGRFLQLKSALQSTQIEVLLLLRLIPIVPFFVANLVPALVGVRAMTFLWTTAIGIIPGAVVFTSIGDGVGEVFARGERPDVSLLWAPHVIGPIAGLCLLTALPIAVKALRRKKDL